MSDLMKFLRARWDEDEEIAKLCHAAMSPIWNHLHPDGQDVAAHVARHNPTQVLREVETKRQIMKLHQPRKSGFVRGMPGAGPGGDPPPSWRGCSTGPGVVLAGDDHLRQEKQRDRGRDST